MGQALQMTEQYVQCNIPQILRITMVYILQACGITVFFFTEI